MEKLKVLDLFSGIGGFSIGLERTGGFETVAFCEIDPYCQKVLNKHWPDVPIYDDVRTLDYDGPIDVITGGFPCQPYSIAGQQRGDADDRDLWPIMFDIIKRYKPTWVIGENVTGFVKLGLDRSISNLEAEGFTGRAFNIPACSVKAPHKRERIWVIAYSERNKSARQESHSGQAGRVGRFEQSLPWNRDWKSALCEFRGMDDGTAYKVDRVDTIRNAVVPQIPEMIGYAILNSMRQNNA